MRKPWIWKGYVDMSWNPINLFNLSRYSRGGAEKEMNKTTFQLRWRAKQLAIPYHAGHITQHKFIRTQQKKLPSIHRPKSTNNILPYPPTTMLTFAFMERRVEVAIFRACLAPSVNAACRYVLNGHVTVNGRPIKMTGYVLEDGDIVQVRADHALTLKPNEEGKRPKLKKKAGVYYPSEDLGLQEHEYMSPWMFVPEYLEVNYNNLSFCFLRSPLIKAGKCEVPSPYDDVIHQRVYDFYNNYRKL